MPIALRLKGIVSALMPITQLPGYTSLPPSPVSLLFSTLWLIKIIAAVEIQEFRLLPGGLHFEQVF